MRHAPAPASFARFPRARPGRGLGAGLAGRRPRRHLPGRRGRALRRADHAREARRPGGLAYHGDEAPEGTRQAQFHLDADGTVQEITVFLATPLDAETIQGTYGKPPHRTFVEDTFQKVWVYPAQGVTVYFGKDGSVEALSFASAKAQAAPARPRASAAPAAATPASPPAGAR